MTVAALERPRQRSDYDLTGEYGKLAVQARPGRRHVVRLTDPRVSLIASSASSEIIFLLVARFSAKFF